MQAQQRQYFNSKYSSQEAYKSMEERKKDFLSEKIAIQCDPYVNPTLSLFIAHDGGAGTSIFAGFCRSPED